MSDWLAHMSGVASALAGLDLDMPGDTQYALVGASYWMYELTRAVLNGSVPMERLNDMATRVVATWYQMGQDEDFPETNFDTNSKGAVGPLYWGAWPNSPVGVVNEFVQVQADHHIIARQIAQDAITLLKNQDDLLPLSPKRALKVFGTAAQTNPDGPNACPDRRCNKGTLGQGWGSGTVDYMYLDDPISALRRRAGDVTFYDTDEFLKVEEPTGNDVAIVFITSASGENTYIVEGNHGDRDASGLYAWHNGDKLIQDVAATYLNVIVIVQTVGPLNLEQWIDLPSVRAVLFQHLPGQEAGESLTSVLFGDVSPSGHLPYSITYREEDLPASVTDLIDGVSVSQHQDNFSEGLYVDYRYLDAMKIKPRYAFGYGLSYTTFSYTNASIKKVTQLSPLPPPRPPKGPTLDYSQPIPPPSEATPPEGFTSIWRYIYSYLSPTEAQAAANTETAYPYPQGYTTTQHSAPRAGGAEGGNPALWDIAYSITLTVTNTGPRAGKASAQLYLQYPPDIPYDTPVIQLRDFEKTGTLQPGGSEVVELRLTRKDVSVWDVGLQDWVVPKNGGYKVSVGGSSSEFGVVCFGDGGCEDVAEGPI